MVRMLVYPIGSTAACRFGAQFLQAAGAGLVDHPTPEVTHLLLDVPSFAADGSLRGGGNIEDRLRMLPPGIVVVGGNLNHPALAGYRKIDLLQDAQYLAVNAAITAECALQVAAQKMDTVFAGTPALIIGWGRIGKSLGRLLKSIGADVTIAARKDADRAMITALGFRAVDMKGLGTVLPSCRVVFNTAPEPVLHGEHAEKYRDCILIDLASKPGIEGDDVIRARGLPGVYAPESSGRLIADSFLRLVREAEA